MGKLIMSMLLVGGFIHSLSKLSPECTDIWFTAKSNMVAGGFDEFNSVFSPRPPFHTWVIFRPLRKKSILRQYDYGAAGENFRREVTVYIWSTVTTDRM